MADCVASSTVSVKWNNESAEIEISVVSNQLSVSFTTKGAITGPKLIKDDSITYNCAYNGAVITIHAFSATLKDNRNEITINFGDVNVLGLVRNLKMSPNQSESHYLTTHIPLSTLMFSVCEKARYFDFGIDGGIIDTFKNKGYHVSGAYSPFICYRDEGKVGMKAGQCQHRVHDVQIIVHFTQEELGKLFPMSKGKVVNFNLCGSSVKSAF
jgi:hypothetical protein